MLIDALLLLVPLVLLTVYYFDSVKGRIFSNETSGIKWSVLFPQLLIRQAGFRPSNVLVTYCAVKLVLPLAGLLLLLELNVDLTPLSVTLVLITPLVLPDLIFLQLSLKRKKSIQDSLGFFLDQLIIYLYCGFSLEQAIKLASETGLPLNSPLRNELALMELEIASGRPRQEAFLLLENRTGVVELRSLISAFNQAFTFGGAIAEALQHHAEILRIKQRETGLKRINRKMVLSMAPLVLANFPIFLLLVFFTPLLELSRLFPRLGG